MGRFALIFLMALMAGACAATEPSESNMAEVDAALPRTFLEVQIALNGSGCTESGCHGGDRKGGLNLVEDPWGALVNVRAQGCKDGRLLVTPGNPDKSYLIDKVRGRRLCSGGRMPFGCDDTAARPCLSEPRIKLLEDWIRLGARRDDL